MEEQEQEDKLVKVITFNTLPKDITFDIFSRIPLKKLCQLRCVCKKWLFYLCLNHEFRVFYHQKHKINPILFFTKQITENPSTQLSSYYIDGTQLSQFSTNFDQTFNSIHSCNGILCLITKTNAILYDPITKQLSNLPNSTHFNSTFSFAFGFSTFRNVFKLLHFYTVKKFDNFHYCQMQEVICEILRYPLTDLGFESQEKWKFLGNCPYDNVLCRKNYAEVDEKFYWLIGEKKFNPDCIKIMSFDLKNENFGLIYFPKRFSNRSVECLDLVEIHEKLCLTDRLPWEARMDVWMMVKENDGFTDMWVKKYRIDLKGIDHHDVKILGHFGKNTSSDCESEGEIFVKFGEKSFGFYKLDNGVYRDLASEINMQERGLDLMIKRKYLL